MIRSKARVLALFVAAWLSGCSRPDPTAPSGRARPAAEVTGTWTAIPADPGCTGGPVTFTVTGTDDDVQPFGSLTFTSTWSTSAQAGTLFGTINLRTNVIALRLFGSADPSAATIDGVLGNPLQLADPYATLSPVFGAAACVTTVTASRTAP